MTLGDEPLLFQGCVSRTYCSQDLGFVHRYLAGTRILVADRFASARSCHANAHRFGNAGQTRATLDADLLARIRRSNSAGRGQVRAIPRGACVSLLTLVRNSNQFVETFNGIGAIVGSSPDVVGSLLHCSASKDRRPLAERTMDDHRLRSLCDECQRVV